MQLRMLLRRTPFPFMRLRDPGAFGQRRAGFGLLGARSRSGLRMPKNRRALP
jgi:hypothetical protein